MSEPIVQARDLWLEYGGARSVRALRGLTLAVEAGTFVGIMGPSGSGKSSLLYALAGLRRPTRGSVAFQGAAWPERIAHGSDRRRSSLGFVFQEPFLVAHWTVGENIAVQQTKPNAARIQALAASLGIERLLDEVPDRLSAGERQRASIARALVNDPMLVLADEPTSCLDTDSGRNAMSVLAAARRKAALVVCSHDARMLSGADIRYRLEDGTLSRDD